MLAHNFLFSVIITLTFLLPDFVLPHFFNRFNPEFSFGFSISLCFFFFLMSFVQQKKVLIYLMLALCILQVSQLSNWLYFGIPLSYENIISLFSNFDDVFLITKTFELSYFIALISIVLLFFVQLFTIQKLSCKTLKSGYIFLILVILVHTTFTIKKGSNNSYLRPSNPSLLNSSRLFFNALIHETRGNKKEYHYEPYLVQKVKNCEKNVILIIGESTNTRFLSLYNFRHNTTPFLKNSAHKKNFAFAKGISSSVGTHASLPLFFNLVREPANLKALSKKELNLLKLAKENGYKVFGITAQEKKEFSGSGIEYLDEYYEFNERIADGDNSLVEQLKKLRLSSKNFIVIQPWSMHAPYSLFHSAIKKGIPSFDIQDSSQKEYAIGLLYWDEWIEHLRETVQEHISKDAVIVVTSDHGEALNEENMLGHMTLKPIIADVPVFAFAPENHTLLKWIKGKNYVGHYELGIKVAELLGYNVTNSNDDGIHQYIHGSYFYGSSYKAIRWKIENDMPVFDDIKTF